jgi:hypothetical protein
MRAFFTDEQVAVSKAEWEPQLRTFAASTNAALRSLRRLPIYDQAVICASQWLKNTIAKRMHLQPSEILIIAGDEHLEAAASNVALPTNSIFLYRQAWKHWWSCVFLGEAPWWQEISWSINCPERFIDLSYPHDHNLQLTPNLTYLCSEQVADRGTDTILKIVDDELVTAETFCEWVVS